MPRWRLLQARAGATGGIEAKYEQQLLSKLFDLSGKTAYVTGAAQGAGGVGAGEPARGNFSSYHCSRPSATHNRIHKFAQAWALGLRWAWHDAAQMWPWRVRFPACRCHTLLLLHCRYLCAALDCRSACLAQTSAPPRPLQTSATRRSWRGWRSAFASWAARRSPSKRM